MPLPLRIIQRAHHLQAKAPKLTFRCGRYDYGTIAQGSSAFAKKASGEEEKYIHEHEVDAIAALRKKSDHHDQEKTEHRSPPPKRAKSHGSKEPKEPEIVVITQDSLGYSTTARSGVFGKREGALEDQWIREHEKVKK